MGTYPQGFSYDVKVTGVVMPIVFSPGTFVYVFDTDTDPNAVQATGTFTDTITKQSLLPITSILIFSLSLSSTYLRD